MNREPTIFGLFLIAAIAGGLGTIVYGAGSGDWKAAGGGVFVVSLIVMAYWPAGNR